MDLDLGLSPVYNVKIGSDSYKVKSPRAKQVNEFQKKISKSDGKEIDVFIDFVVYLGLPKEVAEDLDLVQLQKLANGLTGVNEKK